MAELIYIKEKELLKTESHTYELGHYVDAKKKKEYGSKVYIKHTYTDKNGDEHEQVDASLTLEMLQNLKNLEV